VTIISFLGNEKKKSILSIMKAKRKKVETLLLLGNIMLDLCFLKSISQCAFPK
jgi:hypothetical protein